MLAEEIAVTIQSGGDGQTAPLHRQIYEQLRAGILGGRLRPGDRLPSTRELAARLEVARNTVARSYADLLAEGYLEGQIGSGTYVSGGLESGLRQESGEGVALGGAGGSPRGLAEWGERVSGESPPAARLPSLPYDFRLGTPDWDAFPRALWLQLLGRAMRRGAEALTRYGEPAGYHPLRQAIARHLAVSRGVVASAEQVVIVSGSQQALDLLTRLRVARGDTVVAEDPGYPEALQAFVVAGARVLFVPVDSEGVEVERLVRDPAAERARLIYLTPSHQFPTGVTLSLSRRLALLEWASSRDVLIVEDDYDSEFRYTGRPVEALQGLDRRGQVAYVGTFATVLFPPLRVGYVVLPPDLVETFVKAKWLADRQTPTLEQLALADFLAEGHFVRHLRRMRRLALSRRESLLAALQRHPEICARPPIASTGMHLMLSLPSSSRVDPSAFERAITARAASQGVGVYPCAPYFLRPPVEPALLLGYAGLPEERIEEGISRLAVAVKAAATG